jgi:hypothetical protein
MSKTPEQVAYDLTSGEPFVQLSTFEREWAKNQIEAAIQEERDTALQQCANGVAKLEAVGSILGRNGCDCECDHHHEEHDTDCERCLACLVGDILAIETDATATPSAQESSRATAPHLRPGHDWPSKGPIICPHCSEDAYYYESDRWHCRACGEPKASPERGTGGEAQFFVPSAGRHFTAHELIAALELQNAGTLVARAFGAEQTERARIVAWLRSTPECLRNGSDVYGPYQDAAELLADELATVDNATSGATQGKGQ